MFSRRLAILVSCPAALFLAAPSRAQEEEDEGPLRVLSSDEMELRRRRTARPVLACSPREVTITLAEDETRSVRLIVRNAGGRTLQWLVVSAPAWARPGDRTGKLGFGEKADLILTVDSEKLGSGLTRGEVVIEAPGAAGSPVRIPIRITYTAPPEDRPRARPGERVPFVPAAPRWRWSFGVPLIGGWGTGISGDDENTGDDEDTVFGEHLTFGPILFAERHWGARSENSIALSGGKFHDTEAFEMDSVGREIDAFGFYDELFSVRYRRYFGRNAAALWFVGAGLAMGQISLTGERWIGPGFEYDFYDGPNEPSFLLSIGTRLRSRGGRSRGFVDVSLNIIPTVEYELWGEWYTTAVADMSLMFGWSLPARAP